MFLTLLFYFTTVGQQWVSLWYNVWGWFPNYILYTPPFWTIIGIVQCGLGQLASLRASGGKLPQDTSQKHPTHRVKIDA